MGIGEEEVDEASPCPNWLLLEGVSQQLGSSGERESP